MLRLRRMVAIIGCGAGLAIAAPASAFAYKDTPEKPTTTGGTIIVSVSGTGVRGGSEGRPAGRTVSVPSPCYMLPGMTGKAYYEWVKSGDAARLWRQTGSDGVFKPKPGYEQYKDDDQGRWYGGACSSELFGDDLKSYFEYSEKWFAEHDSMYVPAGQLPPVPPIPPELLRDVASDELTLPKPAIDWNPKRNGDASTLVNVDTWVWLTDQRKNLYVEATANTVTGVMTARVDANLSTMTVSAPAAETTECVGAGVPYAPGATGECSISIGRASPAGGKTPVTTSTTWAATWSFTQNGDTQDRGAVPQQPAAQTQVTDIGVGEVQAVAR